MLRLNCVLGQAQSGIFLCFTFIIIEYHTPEQREIIVNCTRGQIEPQHNYTMLDFAAGQLSLLINDFVISGMNLNSRRLLTHVEYEPQAYCEAFYVELEAASSPLWSFVNACTALVCLWHYSVLYFLRNTLA